MKRKVKEDYTLSDSITITEDKSLNNNEKNSKYLVVKALSYMKSNVTMNLTLKDVSDYLYISTWYLSKLIKKETGNTFINTLSEMRIDEAKKLLLQPQYTFYLLDQLQIYSQSFVVFIFFISCHVPFNPSSFAANSKWHLAIPISFFCIS